MEYRDRQILINSENGISDVNGVISLFMKIRSKHLWMVAFFLSKYGQKGTGNESYPPVELKTMKWKEAYRMFYEALSDGRSIDTFEHSLKNARDAFDSHLDDSNRIGWLAQDGKPNKLNQAANAVFNSYSKADRLEIWSQIKALSDLDTKNHKEIIDDLAAIQNMEAGNEKNSKTEGGVKVVISVRHERNITLRNLAFKIHGCDCAVCGFNFAATYGDWGEGFGEVHHLSPVSEANGSKRKVHPATDLVVLCPNCHRMIHRKKGVTLTVEELKDKLVKKSI